MDLPKWGRHNTLAKVGPAQHALMTPLKACFWLVSIAVCYYGAWRAESVHVGTKGVTADKPRPASASHTPNYGLVHEVIQFFAKWFFMPQSCIYHTLRGDPFLRRELPVCFGKIPFYSETLKFVTSQTLFYHDNFDRYPNGFTMNVMGSPITFLKSPKDIKMYLCDRDLDFAAGFDTMVGRLGPAGILSPKTYHKNKVVIKKALVPSFFDDFVPDICDITDQYIDAMVRRKGTSAVIDDIFVEMDNLFHCLEVCNFAGRDIYEVKDPGMAIGTGEGMWPMPEFSRYCMLTSPERIVDPTHQDEHVVIHVLKSIAKVPYFGKSRIDKNFDEMVRMIQEAAADRKRRDCKTCDVFNMMMEEYPGSDTDYESAYGFACGLWAMILGAQNNSYATACWILANTASNEPFLAACKEERRRVLGDKPLREATTDEIFQMTLVWYAMLEVQRIYARGTSFRQTLVEKKVGDNDQFVLPPGRTVAQWMSTWVTNHLHYDFDAWSDPGTFDPYRFSPERNEQKNLLFNGYMFGHGQNPCMGTKMARLQITLLLHKWLERMDYKCLTEDLRGDDHSNAVARGVNTVALEYKLKC